MSDEILTTLKIIIFGSSSVGKTCLLQRYARGNFSNVEATIGVDFLAKKVNYEGHTIKLCLWDTAGAERFDSLPLSFFRGVHGAVVVYDISNRKTFVDLQFWIRRFKELHESGPNEPILMVLGNKFDLPNGEVSSEEGSAYARKLRALFLETSAKTNFGVEVAFEDLICKIMQTPGLWRRNTSDGIVQVNQVAGGTDSKCASYFKCWT